MSQYWPFSGLTRYGALRERLIVSLDLGGRCEALKMVDQLGDWLACSRSASSCLFREDLTSRARFGGAAPKFSST